MFYRRKIILALLQLFNGQLDKIRLQKLLFLFAQRQDKAVYDFIPYKFGCFSFSSNADLTAMVKKGIISEDEKYFAIKDETDYFRLLKLPDQKLLREVRATYGKMSATVLMRHTYIHFPFYAINSEAAANILNPEELQKVIKSKPKYKETLLFTIGYEGISLEEYLVRLLKNDIKLLVDVRNNPLSMKYGFSKSQLKKYCESVGIDYVHIPELGILSEQRQKLNTQADYDKLFSDYRKKKLPQTTIYQHKILEFLKEYNRIALTCFEANICQCHRKPLADAIGALPNFNFEVKHI